MKNRFGIRAFVDGVEVPNHDAAIDNLDFASPKLRIERKLEAPPKWFVDVWTQFEAERAAEIPNRLHGAAINAEGEAI